MDPLAYPIFSLISMFVRGEFNPDMDQAYIRFQDYIGIIAVGIETLYLIKKGFVIAFQKQTAEEKSYDIEELIYHCCVVAVIIGLAKTGTLAFDAAIALKQMMVEGLIGDPSPPGEQIADSLRLLDLEFSLMHVLNSVTVTYDTSALKSTMVTLALVALPAPQISAGILLIFSELVMRTGMAFFPMALYCALYKTTRDIFMTWVGYIIAIGIQMAASAVVIKLAVNVTGMFVGAFSAIIIAQSIKLVGDATLISEFQQMLIQAGFGMTLSVVIFYFPTNVASYSGPFLKMAGATLENTVGQLYKNDRTVSKRDWSGT